MHHFLFAVLFIFACLAPQVARADGVAFPPAHCSSIAPFMSFTGTRDNYCSSGQSIFSNALLDPQSNPSGCDARQKVVFNGTTFTCKTETNVPTCQPQEFLSFDGQTYHCKSTGVATCGNNQVLTFDSSGYFCVNKDATIPVCGASQFLTYNGSYQCATVHEPTVPTFGAGQMVTANGAQFYCVDPPSANVTAGYSVPLGTRCGTYTITQQHLVGVAPGNSGIWNVSEPCPGYTSGPPPKCPEGYSLTQTAYLPGEQTGLSVLAGGNGVTAITTYSCIKQ